MHLDLDASDTRPLPTRLAAAIRTQIVTGVVAPGEAVDSTRALATQLGISRGSVVAAYDQLTAEGYLVTTVGSGTHVNPRLPHAMARAVHQEQGAQPGPQVLHLTPGLPDSAGIITAEWRAAWRTAAAHPLDDAPLAGLPALRAEVASHLRHMRGLDVDPGQILITAGARDGLASLLRALGGASLRIGVESPGYPGLRRVPAALGHQLIDIPADSEGVTIPEVELDLLIVTPSHQYPYGGSLSAQRRAELVTWAANTGTLIIEDDFDSELRYVGQPLPALAELAGEHTVLLGTFSTIISPSIACGYLVLPSRIVPDVVATREVFGQPVSALTQAALAHYLASGALRRHTVRMRRAYKRRRDLVYSAFAGLGSGGDAVQLVPIRGGLHAVVLCTADAAGVVERASAEGIGVKALADYWGGSGAENGIVFGFGHISDEELGHALDVVVRALRA